MRLLQLAKQPLPNHETDQWRHTYDTKELAQIISPYIELVAKKELRISYKDTDGRLFMSTFKLSISSLSDLIVVSFIEILVFPVDKSC